MGRTLLLTLAGLVTVPGPEEVRQAHAPAGFEIHGPAFFALQVGDVNSAAEWYRRAFGLRAVKEIDAEDGRYRIRILRGPVLAVELIEIPGTAAPSERHLGLFKAGIYVDDIEAALAWLRQAGAETDTETFVDEALGARSFLMRDPEGNRLQVFSRCDGPCP